jgi:hypothetical protein
MDQIVGYTHFKPRSMATIWGSNLAAVTASTAPPWPSTLGGAEVHLVIGAYTPCATTNAPATLDCERSADLTYVSPTQINFVVPDISVTSYGQSQLYVRVVLIRDGVRFDNFACNTASCIAGAGLITVDPGGDFALFQVGYDCFFSLSQTYPDACGFSQSQGQARTILGAVTDTNWNLISSQNPIHQGQIITLWVTGLGGLSRDNTSGLLQQTNPTKVSFGLSQIGGLDIPTWGSQTPIWTGESPQFVGLDQINVVFPACATGAKATVENRYDAYMSFGPVLSATGGGISSSSIKIYMPLLVGVNDPDCPR